MTGEFYDDLEIRDPALREAQLMAHLPLLIAHAQARSPAMAELLKGIHPASINTREALMRLPVTRRPELLQRQIIHRGNDPFGEFSTIGWGRYAAQGHAALSVFASPGPLYEPQGKAKDYWRVARSIFAAGFRSGDLVHNSFSYHMTPGGMMHELGAQAVGCTVFPGGTGQTEQQVIAMSELKPAGYIGTPSFLKVLLVKAIEQGVELPSLKRALVSGEAFPPSLREWLLERGIEAYQSYAMADLGLIAYETQAREGMVLDEGLIVEIVRPGTGDQVPEGEVGEVVVTPLNPDYPLIRFGTGDLSAIMPGMCPTGRTQTRIRGWMGRADQTLKVRGLFVHPTQIATVLRSFPEVKKARLVVSGEMAEDRMILHAEIDGAPEGLVEKLVLNMREVTRLRAAVLLCKPGTLPNDGKVIEDLRRYE